MNAPTYILGHAPEELRRLELQATALEPLTTRLLRDVGLEDGMSVLDIGTGAGDVAMLAGAIVGPGGRVRGIDRNAAALARASARTGEARLDWVSFDEGDFDADDAPESYDLVIGRYVLMHQADPASFLRRAAARVRPGGAVAFLEMAEHHGHRYSDPPVPAYDAALEAILDAFIAAGANLDLGCRLVSVYAGAGLPEPQLVCDAPVSTAASIFPEWVSRTNRTVCPVPDGEDSSWEPLAESLRAAAAAANAQLFAPRNVASWTRVKR